ncbi:MAG TPA: 30S ribosomal protein S12 methylthiotransferase RimO [Candidatus Omnitrophica bacterium]|nr:30S ribosomal protein S12 methylthiotransferase RimO [Candidatus Omnitrophota bacterium]
MIKSTKDFSQQRVPSRREPGGQRDPDGGGRKVGVINLGCARNLVDSQTILGNLKRQGHRITTDVAGADMVVVNTCAFIEESKKESVDTILDLIELKKQGKLKKIVVAGCLAQRYSRELAEEFKEVDAILGVQKLDRENIPAQVSLTPRHFAYLKICESCYNHCSFCIIPSIKGKFVSRSIESVVREVKQLDERGVKEVNIIGQDITAYGMDIYREKALARLLKEIVAVTKNIRWVRLLYAFPAHVTDELIDTIAREERICKYIDIPLQHISDNLLQSMNRSITARQSVDLIKKIRAKIPGAHIRTSFIVGLPGETEENFQELMDFVRAMSFDRVGAFVYSREEGTPAYAMPGQVPDLVKRKRLNLLMALQREISQTNQKRKIGCKYDVLIDEAQEGEKGIYPGRTQYDAHEVDGVVYVHSTKELAPGDIVPVEITDSCEYDLVGNAL